MSMSYPAPAGTKVCPRCRWSKPLVQFSPDASKASGRKSWCKGCEREKARAYYAANREERLSYFRGRQAAGKEDGDE